MVTFTPSQVEVMLPTSVITTSNQGFTHFFSLKIDPAVVNWNIEREVVQYERKYRGRELPGFINYKTFEGMVKEQIKLLEEPAVLKLKEVAGMSYHGATMIVGHLNFYI